MRRLRVLLSALAALLVASFLGAPAASAYVREWDSVTADNWVNGKAWCVWQVPDTPAIGCWFPEEDDLQVADLASDSRRVGLQWKTSYGRFGICVHTKGADSYFASGSLQGGQYSCNDINLAEGATISFRVGTCNGSQVDCTVLSNWGQWSAWSADKTT